MNQPSDMNAPDQPNDQTVVAADGLEDGANGKTRSRFRFGLLELLLLIALVAGWLPVWIARQKIPKLEAEIETMRLSTLELIVTDESELTARELPSIAQNVSSWKYNAPDDVEFDLRLATEGINVLGLPTEFQSFPLPSGLHTVHVDVNSDAKGHHALIYVDDELVLEKHHPKDWVKSGGSSTSGDVADHSTAYPVDQALTLMSRKISTRHPLHRFNTIMVPAGYDSKGTCVWIAPRQGDVETLSDFQLKTNGFVGSAFGHRQGMRITHVQSQGRIGLLSIEPSWQSTLGERRWNSSYTPVAISVRPIVAGGTEPEIPELQKTNGVPSSTGLTITLRETIDKSADSMQRPPSPEAAIGDDPQTMHLFAHYPAFASGAKPIVEILFDARYPNRIGFLPHAAPESAEMEAIQFVTQFDAKFLWRQVELLGSEQASGDSDAMPTVPLAKFYPEQDFTQLDTGEDAEPIAFTWQTISLADLPKFQAAEGDSNQRQLTLKTDVRDSTKLTFPLGLPQKWQYEGVPNLQRWLLPTNQQAAGDQPIGNQPTVEIRAVSDYPETKLAVPGGPVIGNLRITLPMPATEPLWYEIVSDM